MQQLYKKEIVDFFQCQHGRQHIRLVCVKYRDPVVGEEGVVLPLVVDVEMQQMQAVWACEQISAGSGLPECDILKGGLILKSCHLILLNLLVDLRNRSHN